MQVAQITKILNNSRIDNDTWDEILPIVYNQLKSLARSVKHEHKKNLTLNTTSLVHEAYLKLGNGNKLNITGTRHFYQLAARAMRQILVDNARAKLSKKRTSIQENQPQEEYFLEINNQVTSAEEILDIDKALSNLEKLDTQLAEIVTFHFYGGYTFVQIAEMLGISESTIMRKWSKAKAYIYSQLH
jgi:RNA polymerase sigma factor (TIGR02999 family)